MAAVITSNLEALAGAIGEIDTRAVDLRPQLHITPLV
jgi:hypothetical protein